MASLVAGTFFMEILDGTIMATAAPSMARSLGVQSAHLGVTITSYLFTMAVLIPATVQQIAAGFGVAIGAVALRVGVEVTGRFTVDPAQACGNPPANFADGSRTYG